MTIRRLLFGAVALTLIVGGAACSQTDPEPGTPNVAASASTPTKTHSEADRVKIYETVSELRTDSTLIVRATAVSSTVEKLHDTPHTITTLRVTQTHHGKLPADPVRVRQLGDANWTSNLTPLLAVGREYLLFLHPWSLYGDEYTGQWVTTGEQGMYALDTIVVGAGWRYAVDENPGLPVTLSTAAVDSGAFLK